MNDGNRALRAALIVLLFFSINIVATAANPPQITKAFSAPTVALNGTVTMTVTITNPSSNSGPLTNIDFQDILPSGLGIVAGTPATNCSLGTLTVQSPPEIDVTGFRLPSSGSCTVTATIRGNSAGLKTNTASVHWDGATPTSSADLTVLAPSLAPPTIQKSFGAATVPVNGTTLMSITVTNPNSAALTGVGFTDDMPAGLIIVGGVLITNTCGATATTTQILLSGGTLAASAACSITATVRGITAGAWTNTTTAVTSTNGGTGLTASASLTVVAPPTITKSFTPASTQLNGSSTLALQVTNPNAGVALTGVGFTDDMPAGLTIVGGGLITNTCGATATTTQILLSGGTLAASATCSITATVRGITAGAWTNTTTAVTSTNGGTGLTASAALTVMSSPTITKSFTPASIQLNGSSTLALQVTNPNASLALTGVGFSDALPAGTAFLGGSQSYSACGGTITVTAVTLTAANLSLSGGGSCSITAPVTATTPGTKVNNTSSVTSNEADPGDSASATLTVFAPPTITKSFSAAAIPIGGTTTLTFTLSNPSLNAGSLTGINFTDTLPAGLQVANPKGLTGSCVPIASITATSGSNILSLTNLTLASGASCSFSVNVVTVAEGRQTNTTGPVGSVEGGAGPAATASLFVGPAFQITYAANLPIGESYINISNNGANGAPLLGPGFGAAVGNICVNVYAFSPDEQMISCCSCLVTPNGLANIGVVRDLTSKTLTGVIPTSVVVKLVTTLAGERGTGTNCTNSAAMVSPAILAAGLVGWRTTLHETPIPPGGYTTAETPFSPAMLSSQELASLRGRCANILGNGSGFGICRSCEGGALGADRM
ncbi:MAG: DUF11 domain-containing protein [Acidobacteriia bacterium]|nr:DUF11 domain-containing protein [Terriglobia bacterium]